MPKIAMNRDRIARAQSALDVYVDTDMPDESHARDLISDLLHLLHARHSDQEVNKDLFCPDVIHELRCAVSCFNQEYSDENDGDQPLAVLETILDEGI